jgi:hypothetical protein
LAFSSLFNDWVSLYFKIYYTVFSKKVKNYLKKVGTITLLMKNIASGSMMAQNAIMTPILRLYTETIAIIEIANWISLKNNDIMIIVSG